MQRLPLPLVFKRLGLGVSAHAVYEILEKKGSLGASGIEREARLHRPAVYRGLRQLQGLGLISAERQGRRLRYMCAPRAEVKRLFSEFIRAAEAGIAAPAHSFASRAASGGVRVIEGDAAVREIFDEAISSSSRGDTFLRVTSERDVDEVNRLLSPGYRVARDKKRLERLVISNRGSGAKKRDRLERFIKFLGSESEPFDQNIIKLIYADTIAFIDVSARRGFVLSSAATASFERALFHALYRRLP